MFKLIAQLVVLVIIAAAAYYALSYYSSGVQPSINVTAILPTSTVQLSYPTTTIKQNYVPQSQVISYALGLINNDRQNFSLQNVSYSNITSAQQHAQSMLSNHYFSHWDVYGLKPYMRYTLLGGNGSVQENVAYVYNSSGIDVLSALKQMEHSMMYNDSACCNNGHRDNILNPYHNQVSIGVAYNATTIYFDEDFIDDYITWFYGTPSLSGGNMALKGATASGYSLAEVEVSYDTPTNSMTVAQLDNTTDYSYGKTVAGVGYTLQGRHYYFPNMTTINATTYTLSGGNFDVSFDFAGLISKYGAGEYTTMLWLSNQTDGQGQFIGATYTIFINSTGQQYTPKNV